MSNQGSMSPIVPGGPSQDITSVYIPPEPTALSLLEYAQIMGINPIQFMSGTTTGLFPSTGCTDRWRQYAWQDEDKTSRDELAREIRQAELDIAAELGYLPGFNWQVSERIEYPKFYKRAWTTVRGTAVDGYYKSVKPKYGKFVSGGVRSVEYIASATFTSGSITLVDRDFDGYAETAFISIATTYTDPYAHKLFFSDQSGKREWEIRPVNMKEIVGGVLEADVPVHLLFRPELLAALPGEEGFTDIDPTDQTNLVEAVDIYYETVDPSQGNLFHWNQSSLVSDDTEHTTQLVALEGKVVHRDTSMVTVTPATYDAGTEKFTVVPFSIAREPDYLELSYLNGDYVANERSGEYRVPRDLAQAIVNMATARLPRPLCTQCQNVKDKEERLRMDLAFSVNGQSGDVRFVTADVLRNPFGTKLGEVEAWHIVKNRIKDGDISPRVGVF
jgi:hypothetical protein